MKQYTEAEREALIAEIKYNRENSFCSEKTLEILSIAESALTANPVGVFANRGGVWIELYTGDTFEHPDAMYLYAVPPSAQSLGCMMPDEMNYEQAYLISDYYGDPIEVFQRGANYMRDTIMRFINNDK